MNAVIAAVLGNGLRQYAGLLLLVFIVVGFALAVAGGNNGRRPDWAELGRSLVVGGLLALAVWFVNGQDRSVDERKALQVTLGLQQEMPAVDLHGEDLSGFYLARKNMEGADLEGADLDHATLIETNLVNANVTNADLFGAKMERTVLVGADLSEADLQDVDATHAKLRGARLMETDLEGAQLSDADMREVCLAKGSLVNASLPGARLRAAALTGADLEGARFSQDRRQAYLGQVGLDGAQHVDDVIWPQNFSERAEELIAPGSTGSSPAIATIPAKGGRSGIVDWITGSDTVLLKAGGVPIKVRMIGIDAPAVGEPGGDTARKDLEEFLPHDARVVYLGDKRLEDKFHRRLLYLFTPGGKLVNQLMVERGVAVAHLHPPRKRRGSNRRFAAKLQSAETWARQHALGLWANCPP